MNYLKNIDLINSKYRLAFPENYSFTTFDSAIVLPPPNVTGNLHIGHSLNLFLQDLFVRFNKFNGNNINWIPGTDHAGIATQLLVKNKLAATEVNNLKPNNLTNNLTNNLSDDQFIDEMWAWTEIYEDKILKQIKEMGVLLNWNAYQFTFSKENQKKVSHAFCLLHEKGLIFKDKRMINWDIELQTVISDIESVNKEIDGLLYYIRYTSDNGASNDDGTSKHDGTSNTFYIDVATCRPETIFADEALVVHPDDDRYKSMIGQYFSVPLTNKKIPLISDSRCEMDKGTGALKIDPAHGFLDFEIAKLHNLKVKSVINERGEMCDEVPDWIIGLDRFIARDLTAKKLYENNFILKEEAIRHMVPHGSRTNSILEPVVTDQWFFDMPKLAHRAKEMIENNEMTLVPERFKAIYMHYVDNLQPWCISRQILWGHRIPAWYTNGETYIAEDYEGAKQKFLARHENDGEKSCLDSLEQDLDVLDTWFSSALWPLITLGWPNDIDPKFYPNQFLITGHDILFFWVMKMNIMHIGIMGNKGIPFKVVNLHGLVQDQYGLKMSKSKGNVLDPIELCQSHGRDVLSFALLSTSVEGQNIKFGSQNIDKAKKFLNKIWNAFNLCLLHYSSDQSNIIHPTNHWILSKINDLEVSIASKITNWQSYESINEMYNFFWDDFCDWYLEAMKYLLENQFKDETKYTIYVSCIKLLKIMHPFLPFVTEYFWQEFGQQPNILESFKDSIHNPKINPTEINLRDDCTKTISPIRSKSFPRIQKIVIQIRSIQNNFNYDSKADLLISGEIDEIYMELIQKLTRRKIIYTQNISDISDNTLRFGCSGTMLALHIDHCNVVDIASKFTEIINRIMRDILLLKAKLGDSGFLDHADSTEIESKKLRLAELEIDIKVYEDAFLNI